MNKWYVITGGPSSGKTTLLAELEKLGHATIPEAARIVIDEALKNGISLGELRADELSFQHKVLKQKVLTERAHDVTQLTFFDRGMHDTLAYLRLIGVNIENNVHNAMRSAEYRRVFLLDPLTQYEKDYARTETAEQAHRLNGLLYQAFNEYGMQPIAVPVLSPRERAQFVLQHIE